MTQTERKKGIGASVRFPRLREDSSVSKELTCAWRIVQREANPLAKEVRIVYVIQYDDSGQDERYHWHEDKFVMWESTYEAERERALKRGYLPENEVIEDE